jgi:hypothetical protein
MTIPIPMRRYGSVGIRAGVNEAADCYATETAPVGCTIITVPPKIAAR